jgi:hypothetical protein
MDPARAVDPERVVPGVLDEKAGDVLDAVDAKMAKARGQEECHLHAALLECLLCMENHEW